MRCSENLGAPPVYMLPPGSVIQCKAPGCCLDSVVRGIPSATPAGLGASRAAPGDVCWGLYALGGWNRDQQSASHFNSIFYLSFIPPLLNLAQYYSFEDSV